MVGGEGAKGVIKFFLPYLLVGFFLALTYSGLKWPDVMHQLEIVGIGIALFTSIAETRKLFYTGGDTEDFYFVQTNFLFRATFACAIFVLNISLAISIFLPVILLSSPVLTSPGEIAAGVLSVAFLSSSAYLFLLAAVSVAGRKVANISLTGIQIAMALLLLGLLPLTTDTGLGGWVTSDLRIPLISFIVISLVFVSFPIPEALVSKLAYIDQVKSVDLVRVVNSLKTPAFIRSSEEEAGFVFVLSGIIRDPAFRLSSIGVGATPIMVAIYWSLRRIPVMTFSMPYAILSTDLAAPFASIVVSGVIAHYFISQNLVSSRNHEAKWILESAGNFQRGKFVLGARKALLLTIHVPMTLGIFLCLVFTSPLIVAIAATATFYFLCHVAASWFSAMQTNLPFTLPFSRVGATEMINLVFMMVYSALVVFAIYFSIGQPLELLMLNVFAVILISLLEFYSSSIVSKRARLSAR